MQTPSFGVFVYYITKLQKIKSSCEKDNKKIKKVNKKRGMFKLFMVKLKHKLNGGR